MDQSTSLVLAALRESTLSCIIVGRWIDHRWCGGGGHTARSAHSILQVQGTDPSIAHMAIWGSIRPGKSLVYVITEEGGCARTSYQHCICNCWGWLLYAYFCYRKTDEWNATPARAVSLFILQHTLCLVCSLKIVQVTDCDVKTLYATFCSVRVRPGLARHYNS